MYILTRLCLVTLNCHPHFLTPFREYYATLPCDRAQIKHRRTCCETAMFAAASSFFARSNISQNYNVGGPSSIISSRSGTPAQGSSSGPGALPAPSNTPTFFVGPWKVQSGSHKTTNKRVSVWMFDKRNPELEKMGPAAKERTLEVLKSEVRATRLCGFSGFYTHARCEQATSLSRLRHPCVLGMHRNGYPDPPPLTTLHFQRWLNPLKRHGVNSYLLRNLCCPPYTYPSQTRSIDLLWWNLTKSRYRSPRPLSVQAILVDDRVPSFRPRKVSFNYAKGSPFSTPPHV